MSDRNREDEGPVPASPSTHYRGWRRPGPEPPGGVEAGEGETLDYLSGHFRIFQLARGHRYSTDDVLVAWYGTQCAPRVERAADLGTGIGSVAMMAAWRLPAARFFVVEAQPVSVRLLRKSLLYNGLSERFTVVEGDLRDTNVYKDVGKFDLVLASPPYAPLGTALPSQERPQTIGARLETRGGVEDYAKAAARLLAPGGLFALVFPTRQMSRAEAALKSAGLVTVRTRDVLAKEGEPPLLTVLATHRREDLPSGFESAPGRPAREAPLTIRRRDGTRDPEYVAIRLSLGLPPGDPVPKPPLL